MAWEIKKKRFVLGSNVLNTLSKPHMPDDFDEWQEAD